jgi:alcohol dehydrogenase class IV
LDTAAGVEMETLARRLAHHAGAQQLRDLGVTEDDLETCVREALKRGRDLEDTPPAPSESEIRSLYEAAF